MSLPVRSLLRSRRRAVDDGALRRMWPGAAWDVVTLVWFRGVWNPLLAWSAPRRRVPLPDGRLPSLQP